MEQLVGHCDSVIDREINIVHDALARNDVVFGQASFAGPNTVQVESPRGNRTLHTRNTLIALGTHPSQYQGVDTICPLLNGKNTSHCDELCTECFISCRQSPHVFHGAEEALNNVVDTENS